MRHVTNLLDKLVFYSSVALVAILVFMVLLQTFCRNVFNYSFIQIEEYSTIFMAWLSFLTATYTVRHCGHVAVDFFYNKMPKAIRYYINLITIAVLIFLTSFMTYFGYGLAMRQMKTPLPVTHLPRGVMYMAVPVCSFIMVLFFLEALVECIRNKEIKGVVINTDDQIGDELKNGQKLAEMVLNNKEVK